MSYKVLRGYTHTQSIPSTSWVISHNLGLDQPIVDVFVDDNGTITRILPASVVVTDSNTITLTFTSARSGTAEVV